MAKKDSGNGFKDLLDIIGGVVAFFTVILYALLIANANWPFIPEGTFLNILNICKFYASLLVVLIAGLEFVSSKKWFIRIIFYIIVVAVIIFMFFPGTWSTFVGIIK